MRLDADSWKHQIAMRKNMRLSRKPRFNAYVEKTNKLYNEQRKNWQRKKYQNCLATSARHLGRKTALYCLDAWQIQVCVESSRKISNWRIYRRVHHFVDVGYSSQSSFIITTSFTETNSQRPLCYCNIPLDIQLRKDYRLAGFTLLFHRLV